MERIVSAMEGNPDRENIMKVWTECTIGDTIIGFCIKSHVSHQGWSYVIVRKKSCPDVIHDITGLPTEPIKETIKDTVDMAKKKKWGVVLKGFKIWILEKSKS